MDDNELLDMLDDIADIVRKRCKEIQTAVSVKTAEALTRVQEVEERVKKLPAPLSENVILENIKSTISDAMSLIEVPKDGEKGATGEKGERGDQGPKGEKGDKGDVGEKGEQGPAGERGERGEKGDTGPAGERGEKGETGAEGKQGPAGEKGDAGEAGPRGERGEKGMDGEAGAVGAKGDKGERGEKGECGPCGEKGAPGRDGKDALQVEFEPTIDETKSYPRGIWAAYKGGLWRSFETTHGLRGWECVIKGLADIFIEHDGFRDVKIKTVLSDGTVNEKALTIPAMIYRSVYKEGGEYKLGDTVTWRGSLWYCRKDTNEKPIENSEAWVLAAKRGSDGKDLR